MSREIKIPTHCQRGKKTRPCMFFFDSNYKEYCWLYQREIQTLYEEDGSIKKPDFCKAKEVIIKEEE